MDDSMTKVQTLKANIEEKLADQIQQCELSAHDEVTVEVASDNLLQVGQFLFDEQEFAFKQLIDLCGVDYLAYGKTNWDVETSGTGFSRAQKGSQWDFDSRVTSDSDDDKARYAVVYHLLSITNNMRLRLRVFAADNSFPVIPSVTQIWVAAGWYEREAFDLFGLVFDGHDDLRRILTDYGFIGHPFRKDFPISGHVEMRYDDEKKRVVYEPVSIEPRENTPKIIRHEIG
jgi:NADH-quinone oxidoreductase subunit C